jgi:hypothetical protein
MLRAVGKSRSRARLRTAAALGLTCIGICREVSGCHAPGTPSSRSSTARQSSWPRPPAIRTSRQSIRRSCTVDSNRSRRPSDARTSAAWTRSRLCPPYSLSDMPSRYRSTSIAAPCGKSCSIRLRSLGVTWATETIMRRTCSNIRTCRVWITLSAARVASRGGAERVIAGNLDEDDADAVVVLDPHLGQSQGSAVGSRSTRTPAVVSRSCSACTSRTCSQICTERPTGWPQARRFPGARRQGRTPTEGSAREPNSR